MAATQQARCRQETWLIVAKGDVVGLCGYKGAPENGVAEIGFGIAASRRRHGYATQALAELLTKLAADTEADEATAETAVNNTASQRVLQRNGFLKSGTRTDPVDGELITWRRPLR